MSPLSPLGFLTLAVAATLGLAGCGEPPAQARAQTCWIANADGGLIPLEYDVANLETCAARLEARHLPSRRPVTGAYGGHQIFITAEAIQAAAPGYPKVILLDAAARKRIDAAIEALLERQREREAAA